MNINPLFAIDFYKVDHRRQYPEGTTEIYSNFTPRYVKANHSLLRDFDNQVVMFGLQAFIKNYLIDMWNREFFEKDKGEVIGQYKTMMVSALLIDDFDCSHLEALHDLGYLPIRIKAIDEGLRVPIGVPVLTIVNTLPEFYWLTNYLETALSAALWKPITVATIAFEFKRLLIDYALKTCNSSDHIAYQAHDFSFRGMSGLEDASICGAAHLTSFKGTDCVAAIDLVTKYYDATELVGCSVPATEHSVMCCGGQDGEFETIKRLITETYPDGIVSIVADTYNLWKVLTVYLPSLYKVIDERPGKVVIRPDSGNPYHIICGNPEAIEGTPENVGVLNLLWELFGGRINNKGYKELNPKIGLIYGDSITLNLAEKILKRMDDMGFASNNIVFGVGSFTYQYITRDTFGFAMKATSAVINGERKDLFKNPVTDNGHKKSAKGLLMVDLDMESECNEFQLYQGVTEDEEKEGQLKTVFADGKLVKEDSLHVIRINIELEHMLSTGRLE